MADVSMGIKIAENFNRLSRAHERYRQTTDGRTNIFSMTWWQNRADFDVKFETDFTLGKSPLSNAPTLNLSFPHCTLIDPCATFGQSGVDPRRPCYASLDLVITEVYRRLGGSHNLIYRVGQKSKLLYCEF